MTRVDRSSIVVALSCLSLVTAAGFRATPAAPQVAQSAPAVPARLTEMQHHFADVLLVHDAVIRGDLASVREPALRVAAVAVPAGMPATAAGFVADLRRAGQSAADAKSLAVAARATVAMVTACASCHRAVGTLPAPPLPASPDVGGLVGHMLEHQRAADDMLLGLMIPSPMHWREGAERLRTATLRPSNLPQDPKFTKEIVKADARVHQIAAEAIEAETPKERADAYTQLLANCAQCHGLHSKVWGPGRGK